MDDLLWQRRWMRVLTYGKFALMVAGVVVCVELATALHEARRTMHTLPGRLDTEVKTLNARADRIEARLNATLQNVNAILLQAGLAADQARLASQDQREFGQKFDTKALQRLDESGVMLRQLGTDLHQTSSDLHESLVQVPPLLSGLRDMTVNAGRVLDDPDIPRTLHGLADSSEEMARVLREVDATTKHVNAMSAEIDDSLHRRLHPSRRSLVGGWLWTTMKLGVSLGPLLK